MAAAGLVLSLAGAAARQPESPAAQPAPPAEQAPRVLKLEDLPAIVRVGVRAEIVRRRLGVVPVVVVVPDAASYVAAIGQWHTVRSAPDGEGKGASEKAIGARYPVLIDDGTARARQDIGRFVRAFGPLRVVMWKAEGTAWPPEEDKRRALIERAAAAAWRSNPEAADDASLLDRLRTNGLVPPGVIGASVDDAAWPAALALAAGRGELIEWVKLQPPMDPSASWAKKDAEEMSRALGAACERAGLSWRDVGDNVDAVTLCLHLPATVRLDPGDPRIALATTDVIGRHSEGEAAPWRWAWAGQIFGVEARAAYVAMSAIFLMPHRAWLFDGYEDKEPWNRYDATAGARLLRERGLECFVSDDDVQGSTEWRGAAAGLGPFPRDPDREPPGGVEAGLITVNTSGMTEYFDLRPGQCRSADVPFLRVPAIVYFVHSWSASRPADRATIAGRFLERGAYAYAGAVHEPFLQAFVPTPQLVQRLLAGVPWGAAARLDEAPVWKVAIFGDPLITLGPPAPRVDNDLPLQGAADLTDAMNEALKAGRYAEAMRMLAMLGRDDHVARLALALLREKSQAVTSEVAETALVSALLGAGEEGRRSRLALMLELADLLGKRMEEVPEYRDALWHAATPQLAVISASEARRLGRQIRGDTFLRDVEEVARAIRRAEGPESARDYLTGVLRDVRDAGTREAIEKLVREMQ
jgi:hypothetical protein